MLYSSGKGKKDSEIIRITTPTTAPGSSASSSSISKGKAVFLVWAGQDAPAQDFRMGLPSQRASRVVLKGQGLPS